MSTIYHKAAADGRIDLLKQGTRHEMNRRDEDGQSAVHIASFYGHLQALRVIVGRGGNPDKNDYWGRTPLHLASANNHMHCVSFLVNFGANLWQLDNGGSSAIDTAAFANNEEIVRFLDAEMGRVIVLNPKRTKRKKQKAIAEWEKRVGNLEREKRLLKMQELKLGESGEVEKSKIKNVNVINSNSPSNNNNNNTPIATLNGGTDGHNNYVSSMNDCLNFASHRAKNVNWDRTMANEATSNEINHNNGQEKWNPKNTSIFFERDSQQCPRNRENRNKKTEMTFGSGLRALEHRFHETLRSIGFGKANDEAGGGFCTGNTRARKCLSQQVFYGPQGSAGDRFNNGKSTGNDDLDRSSLFDRPGFGSLSFRATYLTESSLYVENQISYNSCSEDDFEYNSSNADCASNCEVTKLLPAQFLASIGLREYCQLFATEKIDDMESFKLLTVDDLKEIGIPLGPRKLIIDSLKNLQDNCGKTGKNNSDKESSVKELPNDVISMRF